MQCQRAPVGWQQGEQGAARGKEAACNCSLSGRPPVGSVPAHVFMTPVCMHTNRAPHVLHAYQPRGSRAHLAKWMGICAMLLAIDTSAPRSSRSFTIASHEPPTALYRGV